MPPNPGRGRPQNCRQGDNRQRRERNGAPERADPCGQRRNERSRSQADKPNSVRLHRSPLRARRRRNDHSSRPAITGRVQQTYPETVGRAALQDVLPIWSCSVRGFACHFLLPEARCALRTISPLLMTRRIHATRCTGMEWRPSFTQRPPLHRIAPCRVNPTRHERYIFCATIPSGYPARALPGALPSGVRTFLPRSRFATRRSPAGRPDRQRSSGLAAASLFDARVRDGVRDRGWGSSSYLILIFPTYPSVSCVDPVLLELLVQVAAGCVDRFAVFEMFQPVSRSFWTRKARSATSLCSRSVAGAGRCR